MPHLLVKINRRFLKMLNRLLDFPAKKESVFVRIEVGESEDNTYCCFRRSTLGGSRSDQWLIGINAKSMEDVPALLKRARQFQRAGVEMRHTRL